jgi:hypothetical protein
MELYDKTPLAEEIVAVIVRSVLSVLHQTLNSHQSFLWVTARVAPGDLRNWLVGAT